jgi:type I restriction enzyme R subunit
VSILDQAVERFQERDEEERETVKTLLVNFRNMYGFLSQVTPYQDSDLEQLYTYVRFLLTKLPKRDIGPGYHLDEKWSCNTTAYKRSAKARSNSTQATVNRSKALMTWAQGRKARTSNSLN